MGNITTRYSCKIPKNKISPSCPHQTEECSICLQDTSYIGKFRCCQMKGENKEGGICPSCVKILNRISVIQTKTVLRFKVINQYGIGLQCPFCRTYHIETKKKKDRILKWFGNPKKFDGWICTECDKEVSGDNCTIFFINSSNWYCICSQCKLTAPVQ